MKTCLHITALVILFAVAAAGQTTAALLADAEALITADRFEQALPLLQQASAKEPQNVEVLYRLGYVCFRTKRLAEARDHFGKVLKISPPAYFSRYFLGRMALLENKPREAVTWLSPIVEAKEGVFDSASQLASAYAALGQTKKAVPALEMAIANAPWDSALYYRLGRLRQQLGQAELAKEAFATSSRLKSANREDVEALMAVSRALGAADFKAAGAQAARVSADPDSLVALGVLYGNANQPQAAMEYFVKAVARNPQLFQAQFNLGLARLRAGQAADALAPLEIARGLLPQSLEANVTLGIAAVMNRDYARAEPVLERAHQMEPDNLRVASLLATAYLRTSKPAKAAAVLRVVADGGKVDSAAMILLVEALAAADDQAGALAAAQKAAVMFPDMPEMHMLAAQRLVRVGKYQEARPEFEAVLKFSPGFTEAHLGLADCLQKAAAHAEALPHYQAAISGAATEIAARGGMARSLIALRKYKEAREVLEAGVSSYPREVQLRLELSRVLARLGQAELAAEQVKIIEQLKAGGAQ